MTTTTSVPKELSVPYFRHVLARAGFTVIDGSALTAGYQFRIERAGRNVFAAHCADDGLIEVFGFTGNSDDAGLHAFADSTEAADFARTIRERGYIRFHGCDNLGDEWALVDCVNVRDFLSPGGSAE